MNDFLKAILDGIHTLIPSYGWSIVSALGPGTTTEQPPCRHPSALYCAVPLDGGFRILGAGGDELAGGAALVGADGAAVEVHRLEHGARKKRPFHGAIPNQSLISGFLS